MPGLAGALELQGRPAPTQMLGERKDLHSICHRAAMVHCEEEMS